MNFARRGPLSLLPKPPISRWKRKVIGGGSRKRGSSLTLRVVTSLFICNYSPSRLISWEDRHVCLVSKGESIILIDGYFRDAGSICRHVCGSVFSLPLPLSSSCARYRVSRAAVVKQKRKKRRGRDIVRFPWQNADKSVWSPRRGRRLWKSRETGTPRETKGRTPSKAPTLGTPGSGTRRRHCLFAALLTMVAVIARVS